MEASTIRLVLFIAVALWTDTLNAQPAWDDSSDIARVASFDAAVRSSHSHSSKTATELLSKIDQLIADCTPSRPVRLRKVDIDRLPDATTLHDAYNRGVADLFYPPGTDESVQCQIARHDLLQNTLPLLVKLSSVESEALPSQISDLLYRHLSVYDHKLRETVRPLVGSGRIRVDAVKPLIAFLAAQDSYLQFYSQLKLSVSESLDPHLQAAASISYEFREAEDPRINRMNQKATEMAAETISEEILPKVKAIRRSVPLKWAELGYHGTAAHDAARDYRARAEAEGRTPDNDEMFTYEVQPEYLYIQLASIFQRMHPTPSKTMRAAVGKLVLSAASEDAQVCSEIVKAVAKYGVEGVDEERIIASWIGDGRVDVRAMTALARSQAASDALHDAMLKHVRSLEPEDQASYLVQNLVTVLRLNPEARRAQLAALVDALRADGELPKVDLQSVISNGVSYTDMLTDGDLKKLEDVVRTGDAAKVKAALWLSLLHRSDKERKQFAGLCLTTVHASLPQTKTNLDAFDSEPNAHFFPVLAMQVLGSHRERDLDRFVLALRNNVGLRSPTVSPIVVSGDLSVLAMLYEVVDARELELTMIGITLPRSSLRGFSMTEYTAFALAVREQRYRRSGKPTDEEKGRAWHGVLYIDDEGHAAAVKQMLNDSSQRPDVPMKVHRLWNIAPLFDLKATYPEGEALLRSWFTNDEKSRADLEIASLLLSEYGDRETATTFAGKGLSSLYTRDGAKSTGYWGPHLDLLLDAGRSTEAVSKYLADLDVSDPNEAAFLKWFGEVRQGGKPAWPGMDAYRAAVASPGFRYVWISMAHNRDQFGHYKDRLHDARVLLGMLQLGYDKDFNKAKGSRISLAALLGCLVQVSKAPE